MQVKLGAYLNFEFYECIACDIVMLCMSTFFRQLQFEVKVLPNQSVLEKLLNVQNIIGKFYSKKSLILFKNPWRIVVSLSLNQKFNET